MRISDWSSDVCSSDLVDDLDVFGAAGHGSTVGPGRHDRRLSRLFHLVGVRRGRPGAVRRSIPLLLAASLLVPACGDDDGGGEGAADTTTTEAPAEVRMNEIQVLGSHNSYHLRPEPADRKRTSLNTRP